MTEKEKDKEEILKKLLKNLLEERLSRLEKRNNEQQKDIKFEKDAYKKQELLVKKLCSVKIEPKKPKNNLEKGRGNGNRIRDKTPNILRADRRRNNSNKKISLRSMTPDATIRKKRPEKKEAIETGRLSVFENNVVVNTIEKYIERNFGGIDYEIDIDFKLKPNDIKLKVEEIEKIFEDYTTKSRRDNNKM